MVTEAVAEKKCKVEGCKRPYRAKGYCNVHFRKWRRGELEKKPRYKICSEENCRGQIFRAGYCEKHYQAWIASKKGKNKGPEAVVASAPAAPAAPAPAEAPAAAKE